jgi:hypothetical protein
MICAEVDICQILLQITCRYKYRKKRITPEFRSFLRISNHYTSLVSLAVLGVWALHKYHLEGFEYTLSYFSYLTISIQDIILFIPWKL